MTRPSPVTVNAGRLVKRVVGHEAAGVLDPDHHRVPAGMHHHPAAGRLARQAATGQQNETREAGEQRAAGSCHERQTSLPSVWFRTG